MSYLVKQGAGNGSRAGRELAAFAIARLAANDPRIAADELEQA